jgi:hypothetical protein
VSVLFADLVGFTPIAEKRDPEEVRDILSTYPGMAAHAARFRALLVAPGGPTDLVERGFNDAEAIFDEIGAIFDLAVVRLEHAEWLAGRGEPERAHELLDQARETFERLRAKPWLERADKLNPVRAAAGA